MNISFVVTNQIIARTDNFQVVQDSLNYLYAKFQFSQEWAGQITAVFRAKNGDAYNAILEVSQVTHDVTYYQCLVPWEVLTDSYFDVSVFCGNLITANVVRVYTIQSGYEIGQESREPTPDVFTQIIEKIDGITAESIPYDNTQSGLGAENVQEALDELSHGGGGGGGVTPNIHMTAEVDATTGTPEVEVTKTGTLNNPIFNLAFSGLKGETGSQGPAGETGSQGPKGDTGATPIISATATVSNTTGTPSVNVTKSGTDEAPSFSFAFSNLKGETGSQGPKGDTGNTGSQGPTGATPNISATGSVSNTTGTPSVTITKTGTAENPNFDFAFTNIKGDTGSQGPQGEAGADGSVVTVTQTLQSGTKIAEINVDGTTTNLFAPSGGGNDSGVVFCFFDKSAQKIYADISKTIELAPNSNSMYISYNTPFPEYFIYRQNSFIDVPYSVLPLIGDVPIAESGILSVPIRIFQFVGTNGYNGFTTGYFYKADPEVVTEEMWASVVNPRASGFMEYDSTTQTYLLTSDTTRVAGKTYYYAKITQLDTQPRGETVTQFSVTVSNWTADTTTQSGSTLYKKTIPLTRVDSTNGVVSIGATGTLPTVAEQTAYDLIQYVTIDSAVPCLYLYASDIPTDSFYIKVEGVA